VKAMTTGNHVLLVHQAI